jgi:hypothetical protein
VLQLSRRKHWKIQSLRRMRSRRDGWVIRGSWGAGRGDYRSEWRGSDGEGRAGKRRIEGGRRECGSLWELQRRKDPHQKQLSELMESHETTLLTLPSYERKARGLDKEMAARTDRFRLLASPD